MFDCHQNESNNHGNYYQVFPCNNGCNGAMSDANPGRQFEPYIGCNHCNMTQHGTMVNPNQANQSQQNQFQSHKSGSNVKSNEATALSMTAQPYVPSYVMDIARPMPLTKTPSSNRKNRDSVVTHDSGNYPGNAYSNQSSYNHQLPTQTLTPITCSCCCNNNNGNIEQFLQKPMQQLSMNVPQERGRQMNTNRFSQMIHPGILMDSNGANSMNFVHQEIPNPPVMRSRSSWRTSAQREMDNSSPSLTQRSQFMQPTHTPIFSTHCSCLSNNDSNNVMIFPDQKSAQQSSFDLMGQTPAGHRMSMNDQHSFCMSCNGGQTLKKASLPPASHHTPEQRTSYRQ